MSREDNAKVIGEPHGVNEHGHAHEWLPAAVTTVYRYGYQIDGEKPIYIGKSDDYGSAVREARIEARAARDKIRAAGVTTVHVSWWTQNRTTRTEVEYGAPQSGVEK